MSSASGNGAPVFPALGYLNAMTVPKILLKIREINYLLGVFFKINCPRLGALRAVRRGSLCVLKSCGEFPVSFAAGKRVNRVRNL